MQIKSGVVCYHNVQSDLAMILVMVDTEMEMTRKGGAQAYNLIL